MLRDVADPLGSHFEINVPRLGGVLCQIIQRADKQMMVIKGPRVVGGGQSFCSLHQIPLHGLDADQGGRKSPIQGVDGTVNKGLITFFCLFLRRKGWAFKNSGADFQLMFTALLVT